MDNHQGLFALYDDYNMIFFQQLLRWLDIGALMLRFEAQEKVYFDSTWKGSSFQPHVISIFQNTDLINRSFISILFANIAWNVF